jgi:hypothetical protein
MAYRSKSGKFISESKWRRERAAAEKKANRYGREARRAFKNRERARSPETREKWDKMMRKAMGKQRAVLGTRTKLERQGRLIPRGRLVEISLLTKYRTKRKLRYLKVLVEIVKAGWTDAELERVVANVIRGRDVPPGLHFLYADWQKGSGRQARSGRLEGRGGAPLADQLRAFLGVLRDDSTTIQSQRQ